MQGIFVMFGDSGVPILSIRFISEIVSHDLNHADGWGGEETDTFA